MRGIINKDGNHVFESENETIIYYPNTEMIFVEDREQYLKKVKSARPDIWKKNIENKEDTNQLSKNMLDTIKDLFICGRIDLNRAIQVIANNGDITSISIDDPIETGEKKHIQVYTDEWANDDMVFDVLKAKHGITIIDLEEPKEVALYEKEKERLRRQGKLLPGIPGI